MRTGLTLHVDPGTDVPDLDKTTGIPYIMIGFEWDNKKAAVNLSPQGNEK